MNTENLINASIGIGLILNTFGLNKYLSNRNDIDKCSKINIHIGLTSFFIAGVLQTYKSIKN